MRQKEKKTHLGIKELTLSRTVENHTSDDDPCRTRTTLGLLLGIYSHCFAWRILWYERRRRHCPWYLLKVPFGLDRRLTWEQTNFLIRFRNPRHRHWPVNRLLIGTSRSTTTSFEISAFKETTVYWPPCLIFVAFLGLLKRSSPPKSTVVLGELNFKQQLFSFLMPGLHEWSKHKNKNEIKDETRRVFLRGNASIRTNTPDKRKHKCKQ